MKRHVYKPVSVAVFVDLDAVKLPVTEEDEVPLNDTLRTALRHFYLPETSKPYSDSIYKHAVANAVNCACGYITPKQLSNSPLSLVPPFKTKIWEQAKDRLVKTVKITANHHLYNNEARVLTSEDLAYTEKSASILRNLYDIAMGWPATTVPYLSAAVIRSIGNVEEGVEKNLSFYVYLSRLLSVYEKFCNTNALIRNPGPAKCLGYEEKGNGAKSIEVELCAECFNFRNLYVSKKFNRVCVCNDPFLDDVIYTCDSKTRKFATTYLMVRGKDGVVYYPEIILDVNRVLSYSVKMNHSDPRKFDISTNQITTRHNKRVVKLIGNKHQSYKTCLKQSPCHSCSK